MTRSLLSIAASTALVLVSAHTAAHVRLVTPTPRHPTPDREDNTIKTAPCGVANDERTTDESRITVYEPGETITVEFNETIDHPGFYRVSFDDDGQDAFDAPLSRAEVMDTPALPVLLDDIEDHGPGGYSVEVTLPDVECENCTLQLIQVMSSGQSWAADDIYYTCADIALRSSGMGTGGMGGMGGVAGGGTGGAGSGGMSGSGAGAPPMGGSGFGGMAAGAGGVSAGMSGGGNAATGGVASAAGGGAGGAASGGSSGSGTSSGGTAGMLGAGGMGGAAAGTAGAATAGTSGATASDAPAADEAGCGCRTARREGGARSLSLLVAALGVLALRRQRR